MSEDEYWLQGGPWLELSFFMESNFNNKLDVINSILKKIPENFPEIEIIENEDEINNEKLEFVKGYLYDETNNKSPSIHSMGFRIKVNFTRNRKGSLSFSCSSLDKAIMVNFVFYGGVDDVPEWNQMGVKEEEIPELKNFFIKLFKIYNFPVGTFGYEMYVRYLFNHSELSWPEELTYDLERLSDSEIIGGNLDDYDYLIYNENFRKVNLENTNLKFEKINGGIFIDKHRVLNY